MGALSNLIPLVKRSSEQFLFLLQLIWKPPLQLNECASPIQSSLLSYIFIVLFRTKLGGAFQMSQSKNKNCSELLLTNGMGLDRAPDEILTFIFSPLEVRPPSVVSSLLKTDIFRSKKKVGYFCCKINCEPQIAANTR